MWHWIDLIGHSDCGEFLVVLYTVLGWFSIFFPHKLLGAKTSRVTIPRQARRWEGEGRAELQSCWVVGNVVDDCVADP
jgi:hypothetical protein